MKFKIFCGLLAVALFSPVAAQGFPTKPIRLIVPYSPGGASDITMRALSAEMSKSIEQPVVVENKPGAPEFDSLNPWFEIKHPVHAGFGLF